MCEQCIKFAWAHLREVTYALGASQIRFGAVIGQLGQRLGRGNADADWYAHPLLYALLDLLAIVEQIEMCETIQTKKAFIDRVDFLCR